MSKSNKSDQPAVIQQFRVLEGVVAFINHRGDTNPPEGSGFAAGTTERGRYEPGAVVTCQHWHWDPQGYDHCYKILVNNLKVLEPIEASVEV